MIAVHFDLLCTLLCQPARNACCPDGFKRGFGLRQTGQFATRQYRRETPVPQAKSVQSGRHACQR
jgi:hypothetical protein